MSRLVLAFSGSLLYATLAQAEAPPPGGYLQTCSGSSVGADRVLRARCQTRQGSAVSTSLKLPCAGAIENENGQLRCMPGSPPPQGSYLQTCTAARVQAGELLASCRRINQSIVSASLRLPCSGRIENQDGRLLCVGVISSTPPPAATDPQAGRVVPVGTELNAARRMQPSRPVSDAENKEREKTF
jgi:hypothetical protein